MVDFVVKSPEGRIAVVASRQKFKYIKAGYVDFGQLDLSNTDVKHLLHKGYTKEEIFAMGVQKHVKLEKRIKNGKEHFFTVK